MPIWQNHIFACNKWYGGFTHLTCQETHHIDSQVWRIERRLKEIDQIGQFFKYDIWFRLFITIYNIANHCNFIINLNTIVRLTNGDTVFREWISLYCECVLKVVVSGPCMWGFFKTPQPLTVFLEKLYCVAFLSDNLRMICSRGNLGWRTILFSLPKKLSNGKAENLCWTFSYHQLSEQGNVHCTLACLYRRYSQTLPSTNMRSKSPAYWQWVLQ